MLLIAASLVVAVAVAGCETASAPAPSSAPEVGAKSESATGTVVAAGVPSRCSASPTIPWEEGSELTEVRGSAQGAELWALIFGRVPLRAEEEAKISFRMTGSDPLKLVALGPDGEPVFPRQGPRKHLGSDWERPGEEWGSTFVLPKSGCWRIMVSRGAESGYVSLMVRGAEGGKEGEGMAAPVDVEREAELYPQAPPPEDLPSNFEEEHPGSVERECVYVNPLLEETGRDGAIRSGQFVAGPFTHFVRGWVPHNENKL